MSLPGKKVTLLGLGVSGYASAQFLHRKGFDIFVSDGGNSPRINERAESLRKMGIEVETGRHSTESILKREWALISPGIGPQTEIYQALIKKRIPILSEIEVAYEFSPSKDIVAVTGTAGKTTVTTLMGRVLEKAFGKVMVSGNIGNPWIGEIERIRPGDKIVLELSSFQLAHCVNFRPRVGALLNLAQNHQDWHPTMEDYAACKLRIFQAQQPGDLAIVRASDQKKYFPDFKFKSTVSTFDEEKYKDLNPNEAAVRTAADFYKMPEKTVNDIFRDFQGIEHRLEKVLISGGAAYINDSKCTTTASLVWALDKFADQSVILLAGGHPKSDDFDLARKLIERKARVAILMGEARPLLRRAWQGACQLIDAASFQEAVLHAKRSAKPGDTVLLSPACASFDMFRNYEERGKLFKSLVSELAGQGTRPAGSVHV